MPHVLSRVEIFEGQTIQEVSGMHQTSYWTHLWEAVVAASQDGVRQASRACSIRSCFALLSPRDNGEGDGEREQYPTLGPTKPRKQGFLERSQGVQTNSMQPKTVSCYWPIYDKL